MYKPVLIQQKQSEILKLVSYEFEFQTMGTSWS